ncbi:MAG: AtpZ/AtpI family protein [Pikeienuella sp.]
MARTPTDPSSSELKQLGDKIEALQDKRRPKPKPKGNKFSAAGFGWRMTIDLATGICVGAAMGWGLDSLAGTMPAFLIVMTLVGFAAGVRVMLKSAEEFQKEQASQTDAPEREE